MLAIEAGDHIGVSFAASANFALTTASFTLFQSRLEPTVAVHTPVETFSA